MIVYLQLDQNELNPSNPDSNVKAREGAIVMKKDRVRLGRVTNAKEKDPTSLCELRLLSQRETK